jgi:D-cysteine desulfhydrase
VIHYPHKLNLALIPTPIEPLARLSKEWNIDLRVKRDDLTGAELSGNKIRKLDFLLADALKDGCDTIVTCGASASNHARATALAARKLGLDCHLVLTGEKPQVARGNLLLDLLCGAHVRYITGEEYSTNIARHLCAVGEELKAMGKKPYLIPTGGSNAVGLLGYMDAVREINDQCLQDNWFPDYVVCAVGSGGTYAGLLLGNSVHSLCLHIWGMLVCSTVEHFSQKIQADMDAAKSRFGWDIDIAPEKIILKDKYIAGGYGLTNHEQLQFIRHVAQAESLVLEPVYTGKTFFGLYQEILSGTMPPNSRVLFIHTGGIFGLSAFAEPMSGYVKNMEYWPDTIPE